MSDPVTNIEIEDVLSSIRRLVSEETGLKPRAEPARKPAHENRLVLTPALLVADEPADAPDSTAVAEPESDGSNAVDEETPWDDLNSTLYSAAQIDPDEVSEPETVDESHFSNDDETSEEHTDGGADPEPTEAQPSEDEVNEQGTADDAHTDDQSDHSPTSDDDDRSEDNHGDDHAVEDVRADESQQSAEVVGFDSLTPLSAKIEALEMTIGETLDQWEPDGVVGDDYAGTPVQTLEWEDHDAGHQDLNEAALDDADLDGGVSNDADATNQSPDSVSVDGGAVTADEPTQDQPASVGAFSVEDAPNDEDGGVDFLATDDGIMDEDALRELVADIVREELQGALGERITRNVRKLVRREIHRALTAKELD